MRSLLVIACVAAARIAVAQPAPTPPSDPAPAEPEPTPPPVHPPAPTTQPAPGATPLPGPSSPNAVTVPHAHSHVGFGIGPKVTIDPESTLEQRHAAELVCAAHDAHCDWIATFSSLEKRSIIRTLLRRGLEVDPEPWGKPIEHVIVENEDVFAEDNWLQFFNNFHYTTREHRVREELTIQAGEVWDQARVEESARRLHDPLYTSVVALLPVRSSVPGKVVLLVVTRDIWSLRLNTQYTFQQGALTNLSFSLSENNFLGSRDLVAASVVMDGGAIAVGPYFIDKDFLGKHISVSVRADEIITRQAGKMFDPSTNMFTPIAVDPVGLQDAHTLHSEGADAAISVGLPLWSLASKWGWGTSFTYSNAIARSFTGVDPRTTMTDPYELYTDPNSGLPYEYRSKSTAFSVSGVRQWGHDYKHQVNFGYTLSSFRASVLPQYENLDPATLAQFVADVFPRSETISQPYIGYTFFEPRYQTVRNVGTYELAEDVSLGPSFSASVAQGLSALGGDLDFTRPSLGVGYVWPLAKDGFIHPSASGTMRFQSDALHGWRSIDNSATAQLRIATPTFEWFRVIAQAEVDTRWHDTQNSYYVIGSDSGLRGYNVNQFRSARNDSSRRSIGQLEMRTIPVPWWVFRLGAVAFYEVGGVAESLQHMNLYNDIGFGLRLLVPQTSRELFRFDLAFPLQATPGSGAFAPHLLLGFQSYF